MKKLLAFIISTSLLIGASSLNTSQAEEISKITQDKPLMLQQYDSFSENDLDPIMETSAHYSHSSHRSHGSHTSHTSHTSHRSGY